MNSLPKVSVIVAVYNSEKYIEQCVRSLFEQTLESIEYIFVNDNTPDDSITIINNLIQNYPARKSFMNIINLRENGGVSNARSIGLKHSTGEYIIHADSDDWIDKDMYEKMYLTAKETNADIVGCNFRHEYKDKQYDFKQQYAKTVDENIRRLLNGRIFPSLCTSLTKRELIDNNKVSFPKGLNMGEDLYFNLQLYLHANKIESINWAPYHYRHTDDSSCIKRTRESIDSDISIAGMIEELMRKNNLYYKYETDINYRKFISKLPLIQDTSNIKNYHDWICIYPETNKHLLEYTQIDYKYKIELWLIIHKMLLIAKVFKLFLFLQHRFKKYIRQIL